MKKLMSLLLALLLLVSASFVSFADETEDGSLPDISGAEAAVDGDPFDAPYKEFETADGTLTRVYDNGSVSTRYPDGSRESVDYTGTRYSLDTEGLYTVYSADGSVGREYPDGTKELTTPDGRKETVNTDGSYVVQYRSGLCEKTNPDGTSEFYFPGGTGSLKNNGSGYETGTITGPNGEILSASDKRQGYFNDW